MRCFYHPETDAVAQCTSCGKGLCHECASIYDPILCSDCAKVIDEDNVKDAKKRLRIIRIMGFIGFIYPCALMILPTLASIKNSNFLSFLLSLIGTILITAAFTYIMASIPAGWRKVSEYTDKIKFMLWLPIVGWVVYLGLKLIMSGVTGLFVLPKEYKRLKQIVSQ